LTLLVTAQNTWTLLISNGLTAHAITNHGNMNHLPNQILHLKKMRAEGKEFKNVYGVEAYFIPSIEEWRVAYEEQKQKKKEATKAMSIDESEKERSDWKDLFRRRHLVLFAQNQVGLNNLFKLVSESFVAENFYRFPRIDYAFWRNITKVSLRHPLVSVAYTPETTG
jgi:DNA polymerase III alpha subunit (gram-positive type)